MANAPGQMQGYTLQLQRALLYLLKGEPGSSVCVEVIGDVGKQTQNETIAEEDKSSLSGNPVTNKSTDLWKTFYNWIKMVEDGIVRTVNTTFILYTNQAGKKALVDQISEAGSKKEVENVFKEVEKLLGAIGKEHDIYEYLSYVVLKKDIFEAIIQKFGFFIGSNTGAQEVKDDLDNKFLPTGQIDFIHEELLGWVTNTIMDLIAAKQPPVITHDNFKNRFQVIFERARSKELLDFTRELTKTDADVVEELKTFPYYLRQLAIIGLDDDDQVKAVSDFLRSNVNIGKWIEDEIIDEKMADDFEEKLKTFWKNKKKQIGITNKNVSPEERGVIIYSECMSRQEKIGNQSPPAPTIPGTYHNLSNDNEIGWHELWKKLLKK